MKTKHILSILLLVMLTQCCSKTDPCPKGQENYYNLTDEEKSKIPYTGTDTLVFISDKGDTAILEGKGKSQRYQRSTTGGNPDCGSGSYTYENYENVTFLYQGTNSFLFNIFFTANRDNYSSTYDVTINNNAKFGFWIAQSHDISRYKDTVFYRNNIINCFKMYSYTDTTTNYYFNNLYGIVKIRTNNKIFIKK